MKERVFIDTGAYLALFSFRDKYHQSAKDLWLKIEKSKPHLYTSNHVLDELATLLGRKMNYLYASAKVDEIYSSGIFIERSNEEDEKLALRLFRKYADQKVSFTDCLSFVLMKKLDIHKAFSFDHHFQFAGFDLMD